MADQEYIQQSLSVFFPSFVMSSAKNMDIVLQSLLPTIRCLGFILNLDAQEKAIQASDVASTLDRCSQLYLQMINCVCVNNNGNSNIRPLEEFVSLIALELTVCRDGENIVNFSILLSLSLFFSFFPVTLNVFIYLFIYLNNSSSW